MANLLPLADMKLLNQDHDSVNTALSAFERDMFGGSANEKTLTSSLMTLRNGFTPLSLLYFQLIPLL